MDNKEKVKDFNQHFATILNKFIVDVLPHDSIMIDYYTSILRSNITMFVKRAKKVALEEKVTNALAIEKYLVAVGVHNMQEDSKASGKKSQASMSKSYGKEIYDLESVVKSLKKLTNEASDLKRSTRKISSRNKIFKPFFKNNNNALS